MWWRYDTVALLALLVVAVTGVVPRDQAFSGFGHPAVVVVAAILVVSRGLCNSGAVDLIGKWVSRLGDRPSLQVGAVTGLVTAISGFVSSVGAAAVLIPVVTQMARKSGRSPSYLLMPLAAGSLLGAMITLIGSAPNIIIAMFRARTAGEPFHMFDYAPVGLGVALAGLLFISLIGWRLIPQRKGQASRGELFHIQDYITEVRVPENSKIVGRPLREMEGATEAEVAVVGLVRGEWRIAAPSRFEILRAGDILVVEADSESLGALVDAAGLELSGSKELREDALGSDDVSVSEAVVTPDSPIVGNTAWTLNLRWRYGVNLLGVARQGVRLKERLRSIQFRAGDVLLLQGETETVQQTLPVLGCLPLAERGLRLGQPRRVFLAVGIFSGTITATAMDLLPVETAFVVAAMMMVL
ncbi:MAG: SLC13 family permease, partial [Dehalococcoidia bacterium]